MNCDSDEEDMTDSDEEDEVHTKKQEIVAKVGAMMKRWQDELVDMIINV